MKENVYLIELMTNTELECVRIKDSRGKTVFIGNCDDAVEFLKTEFDNLKNSPSHD